MMTSMMLEELIAELGAKFDAYKANVDAKDAERFDALKASVAAIIDRIPPMPFESSNH